MNEGFFSITAEDARKRLPNSARCGSCGKYRHCQSPKMPYKGKGRRQILIIGEAPGADEDDKNEQFVGKTGRRLEQELADVGIDMNRDCWKQNAVRCRPVKNKTPDTQTIQFCRPALFADIEELQPKHIWLFGSIPLKSVIGHLWGNEKVEALTWAGWHIPCESPNAWISHHYHPSYLERKHDPLIELIFRNNLKEAASKLDIGRPPKQPDLRDEVEIIYKPSQVRKALDEIRSGRIAFDLECNTLKPEYEGSKIISCSVCWNGKRTYAYPWEGEAIDATARLLKTPLKKIAAHMKFEERWIYNKLGFRVNNLHWDTVLGAHILNYAKGVTGVKFQTFVRLGILPYDAHIKRFLKAKKGTHINQIEELPLRDVLEYNGMDSLCEYKLWKLQRKEL